MSYVICTLYYTHGETIFTDYIESLKGFLFKIVDYRFQNLLENKNL